VAAGLTSGFNGSGMSEHVPIGQPDASWRLLSFDPVTGKTDWMKLEGDVEGHHQLKVRTVMPVDDLLALAAAERQMDSGDWKGDMHRVSTMPIHLHERLLGEAIRQDDQKFVSKVLNDPDYAKFRTKAGRV
jgi:hypothetical protein